MRITYFTNNYPAVSHTFIRRELMELERKGHEIQRLSLRRQHNLVDALDLEELKKTQYLLEHSPFTMLGMMLRRFISHPMRTLATLWFAMSLTRSGHKLTKLLSYFAEALILAEMCRSHKSQLLRVHFGTNGTIVARLCRRLGGPPYAVAYHGPDEFDNPIKWDIKGIVAESAFVTSITSFCSGQLMRWTAREHWNKIRIVHCALDQSFLTPLPFPTSTRRDLCIVARLSAQKGLPLLLEGFAQAIDKGADIGLQIVGDGEMREEIESRVQSLGLSDRITLHGSLSNADVRAVLEKSYALVLPSFAEGLPVVLMEAMGIGRPAISTSIAGIPELVIHKENGWLIPSGSIPALVDALIEFSNTPVETLINMGLHGHQEVCDRHTIETEVDILNSIILELV